MPIRKMSAHPLDLDMTDSQSEREGEEDEEGALVRGWRLGVSERPLVNGYGLVAGCTAAIIGSFTISHLPFSPKPADENQVTTM